MDWNKDTKYQEWKTEIINKEKKEEIAKKISSYVKDGDVIGFGSGSTSFLAIKEIAKKVKEENLSITAIPTSIEVKMLCLELDIQTASIMEKRPDWCFDGADEVSPEGWIIKGRGAAMFKEKLNILASEKAYILVDDSKFVDKLCDKFPIPVEVFPEAVSYVKEELIKLGATKCNVRMAVKKDGPVITENNNIILDAVFENVNQELEKQIKQITGVIDSGLFIEYKNIEVIK